MIIQKPLYSALWAAALLGALSAGASEPQTVITSEKVRVTERGKAVEFTGKVVLVRGDDRLTADRVITEDKNTIAKAWGHVTLRRRLPAENLVWDSEGEYGLYDTTASSGTLWGKKRAAEATRRSLSDDQAPVLYLSATMLSFYSSKDTPPVHMAAAKGGAHITVKEKVPVARTTELWGGTAIYEGNLGQVTLEGAYRPPAGERAVTAARERPFGRQVEGIERRDVAGDVMSFAPGDGRLVVERNVAGTFVFLPNADFRQAQDKRPAVGR